MNNFDIDDQAMDLLVAYTPYKIARELVMLKHEYDNLLWEYEQALRDLEELRGDNPW